MYTHLKLVHRSRFGYSRHCLRSSRHLISDSDDTQCSSLARNNFEKQLLIVNSSRSSVVRSRPPQSTIVMPQAGRADRRRSCTAQILHCMPTSDCSRPTDLTSRSSPPAPAPAAHPPAHLADPNHKLRGASPWPGRHRKPLSDGNVTAAAQERRDSLIGLARKLSLVGTGSDQVAGEPGEPRVLSLASMAQTRERARSDGLWLGTNSVHLLRWCVLVVVGINVLAFPFLLSFVGPVSPSTNQTWYAVLLACDVVLWLDVASRFVTPQWEGGDDGEETRLSHRRV